MMPLGVILDDGVPAPAELPCVVAREKMPNMYEINNIFVFLILTSLRGSPKNVAQCSMTLSDSHC